jgi:signal transduction histidine kinase
MNGLRQRIALLVATVAVLPLLVYGLVSIRSLNSGTRQSVVAGNLNLASRAADQIEQFVRHSVETLQSAAADLHGTSLETWQQERILRNYALTFPVYRELTLYDVTGRPMASSRLSPSPIATPDAASFDPARDVLSDIQIDDDLLPMAKVTLRLDAPEGTMGWLVAELRLEEMWRLVDRLRVGASGFALLVDRQGRLIAHGNPDEKGRVARGEDLRSHPLAGPAIESPSTSPQWLEYLDGNGRSLLAVVADLEELGWTLILEQPTDEAYDVAIRLERQLRVAIGVVLLLTIAVGVVWARSLIGPIVGLMRGTQALADGRLDTRVDIGGATEFRRLGAAFNLMADHLVGLQEEARRQERQAMFGRLAAGLVHDLAHPLQNIGNNCRLMLKMYDDAEYRETFRRTVEREMQTVRRVLEDLRNLARPIPLERFPIDVGRSVGETVESMQSLADAAGVTLTYQPPDGVVHVQGDVFALGRVYRNLILNAIQATAPGGAITVAAAPSDGDVRISVRDTGCGIPAERLDAVFEDFVTTKRRGLGLGLPISKKIVEQLGGTIRVESEVGRGTQFTIRLPRVEVAAGVPATP